VGLERKGAVGWEQAVSPTQSTWPRKPTSPAPGQPSFLGTAGRAPMAAV